MIEGYLVNGVGVCGFCDVYLVCVLDEGFVVWGN